jgi:hypothetical protein
MGSTEPHEDNWRATWMKKCRKTRLTAMGIRCADTQHPLPAKVGTNFANKWPLLGRHSSLADYGHRV